MESLYRRAETDIQGTCSAGSGKKYGKTAAQIALQYLVQQGISVIPKSSRRERMIENLDIFDTTLTPDDIDKIHQLETGKTLFGWYDD